MDVKPEPNMQQPEHEHEEGQSHVETVSSWTCVLEDPEDSKIRSFFKKTAEDLVRWLESTFHFRGSELLLYECLVDDLMEEEEILAQIQGTFEAPVGRLLSNANDAVSYIVRCKLVPDTGALEETPEWKPEMQVVSSTVLSQCSLSEFKLLALEFNGSPDSGDDDFSDILSFQNVVESWPDVSSSMSSIPAVQVTEASEDSEVEITEDLEVPACANGDSLSSS
ncbi:hypothetical protein AOLI_G00252550 [Acnodon oligacanthus]